MSQSSAPPLLSVAPTRALVDEPWRVRVDNLPPGAPVTLRCEHRSEDQDDWEAYAHYVGDAAGAVSVADDASLGGTYRGREAMGLLWSMRAVPGSRPGLRLRKRNVLGPMLFTVSVLAGHVGPDFGERLPLARQLVERWYLAPGVRRLELKDRGVRGTLFLPSGPGPFPGLLDMWGGGGGLLEYRSALLASHGYVSLALEYFAPGELASSDLEFQYFEAAFDLVRRHPAVLPDRVGIFGLSLGAMVAISLAAESTLVEPACCVCISGSHFFPRDQPLSQIGLPTNVSKIRLDEEQNFIWRDLSLPVSGDLSRKSDVRRIKCPLLLVNGQDDQNHPTVEYAEDVSEDGAHDALGGEGAPADPPGVPRRGSPDRAAVLAALPSHQLHVGPPEGPSHHAVGRPTQSPLGRPRGLLAQDVGLPPAPPLLAGASQGQDVSPLFHPRAAGTTTTTIHSGPPSRILADIFWTVGRADIPSVRFISNILA
ncbi:peroxisomal succinyl-coenzyme A thioesterase-like isoform X2 [Stigmatopora nigra]